MKRLILMLICAIHLLSVNVYASDSNINEIGNLEEPLSTLSKDSKEILNDIGADSIENASGISFESVMSKILDLIKNYMNAPLKLFGLLVGIAVLTSIYNLLSKSEDDSFSGLAGMLCAGAISVSSLFKIINSVSSMLDEGCAFISAFVPVMTSVLIAGGNLVTATVYNLLLLFSANVSAYLSSGVITSFLGCYIAVSLVSSFTTTINLNSLADGIKKITIWSIGIISTVFVGILSIQGITGKATDTLALKTAKFTLSSTIPIVGSALSDALSSIEGTIGILRAGIGTFGIISGLAIILPTIISVVLTKLSIEASAIVAEMLGVNKLSELYKSLGSAVSIMIALIMFFFLVLLISTTVVMLICR